MFSDISRAVVAFWTWIDDRQIDKHLISLAILAGTVRVTEWAMEFAEAHADAVNGAGVAAILAAVTGPYMALQAAAIKFYFDSRNPPEK